MEKDRGFAREPKNSVAKGNIGCEYRGRRPKWSKIIRGEYGGGEI